ncbi:MAG: response regulator [Elusimicrobiota bacterium]
MTARILVVDDELPVRQVIQRLLARESYEAALCATAEEALERLKENPDIVLLDLNLPGVQDLDLLRRLHEHSPQVPIIVLSGDRDGSRRQAVLRAGAADYLSKPLDWDRLKSTLALLLSLKKSP